MKARPTGPRALSISLLALVVTVSYAASPSVPPLGALPPDLATTARDVAQAPLPDRIDAISKALLGRPYVLDPLGEGRAPDPDPLARYDVFDCLTFTEEVLALAMAGDPAHAGSIRTALRYGEAPARYENRRHFMELQWIPGNIQAGFLRDTTAEYGEPTRVRREITPTTWQRWRARASFMLTDEQLPTGTFEIDVLSIDAALAAVDAFRPGSLLLTVRAARADSPVMVSHVGLIVPGTQPTVRHATKLGKGSVRDHALRWYLEHLRTYKAWPAIGVAVLEPIEAGPRG